MEWLIPLYASTYANLHGEGPGRKLTRRDETKRVRIWLFVKNRIEEKRKEKKEKNGKQKMLDSVSVVVVVKRKGIKKRENPWSSSWVNLFLSPVLLGKEAIVLYSLSDDRGFWFNETPQKSTTKLYPVAHLHSPLNRLVATPLIRLYFLLFVFFSFLFFSFFYSYF